MKQIQFTNQGAIRFYLPTILEQKPNTLQPYKRVNIQNNSEMHIKLKKDVPHKPNKRNECIHTTFSQKNSEISATPQAGKSSSSTNARNFSLLVIHKTTRAPSICASCLIGRYNKYLLGNVG